MKQYTVAIIGLGGRGLDTYAKYAKLYPDRMKIVAVADIVPEKVALARAMYNVPESGCFAGADELLAQGKLADVVIIATQDREHKEYTLRALELGYDILLEKPVSVFASDCIEIRDPANK